MQKSSFFIDHYLKKISQSHSKSLTPLARRYLTDLIYALLEEYALSIDEILLKYHKKTVTEKEIEMVTNILFSEDISLFAIAKGSKAVMHYQSQQQKPHKTKTSTEIKAGILLSVSKIRSQFCKFLFYKPYRISKRAMIMLTTICQYILTEILENIKESKIDKKHIVDYIQSDQDLLKSLSKSKLGNLCQ